MDFNTHQLHCLVEIERTRSVSQAAANLYMSQPNLSRILGETEKAVGFPIFERTRKGVRPTQKGVALLRHARNILREADFIQGLGPAGESPNRFRICLPRSYRHTRDVARFLQSLGPGEKLDAMVKECHPRQALELLDSGSAEVAVIRFSVEYQDYFSEQMEELSMTMKPLGQTEYTVVVSRNSPLASRHQVSRETLSHYREIRHRDVFYPRNRPQEGSFLYTVDRLAQIQMLHGLPDAYMWSEPLEESVCKAFALTQLSCREGGTRYQDALVYKPRGPMSETERRYLRFLLEPENGETAPLSTFWVDNPSQIL